MERKPQSFANHGKFDELFHFCIAPVSIINAGMSIWRLIRNPGVEAIWPAVFGLTLVVAAYRLRTYPLHAQDRVIRLEERLRIQRLMPGLSLDKIEQISGPQIIALRFASDAELPALVDKTLSGNLEPKQIKQAIQNWRPDYYRL